MARRVEEGLHMNVQEIIDTEGARILPLAPKSAGEDVGVTSRAY